MRRPLKFAPQAQRDFESILAWYAHNMGARTAQKVGATIRKRLKALGSGRVRGADASTKQSSSYLRAVARQHVIIFRALPDYLLIARIVHGSQDMEAILANLQGSDHP